MRGILATHVAFSHCYPPLIYYLTERFLFKKFPPTGKSLKKALQTDANTHTLFCSILMQLRDYRLVHIVGMLAFDVTRHAELFEFLCRIKCNLCGETFRVTETNILNRETPKQIYFMGIGRQLPIFKVREFNIILHSNAGIKSRRKNFHTVWIS
jgi:hypothetical protein